MTLLQASSETSGGVLIFQVILRIVGIIVCATRAGELNRNQGGWGFFGFAMPIVAMIWIYCMKPLVKWENHSGNP